METKGVRLSEKDHVEVMALRASSQSLHKQGKHEAARLASVAAGRIINRSVFQALESRILWPDEDLYYLDIPEQVTTDPGVQLTFHLLVDSELYRDILVVLQKHQQKG